MTFQKRILFQSDILSYIYIVICVFWLFQDHISV